MELSQLIVAKGYFSCQHVLMCRKYDQQCIVIMYRDVDIFEFSQVRAGFQKPVLEFCHLPYQYCSGISVLQLRHDATCTLLYRLMTVGTSLRLV